MRFYDLGEEGPESIFSLFERVYGDSTAIRQRWQWEWQQHPEANRIKIVVAEDDCKLIGMTVRMPIRLSYSDQLIDAWFATNSMVDPEFRGRGIIQQLYAMANTVGDIQLSKGTADEMFRQLLKMGYERIQPDNYQVCLLAPWLWLKQKIGLPLAAKTVSPVDIVKGFESYRQVASFIADFDSLLMPGLVAPLKNTVWLNWRYVDIPHRQYRLAVREVNGQIVSWCVIRVQGRTGYLVDLRWLNGQKDEPAYTIRYAKQAAKAAGAIKMVAWGAATSFRSCLLKAGFLNRKETPYFSCQGDENHVLPVNSSFFMLGDGDSDYL